MWNHTTKQDAVINGSKSGLTELIKEVLSVSIATHRSLVTSLQETLMTIQKELFDSLNQMNQTKNLEEDELKTLATIFVKNYINSPESRDIMKKVVNLMVDIRGIIPTVIGSNTVDFFKNEDNRARCFKEYEIEIVMSEGSTFSKSYSRPQIMERSNEFSNPEFIPERRYLLLANKQRIQVSHSTSQSYEFVTDSDKLGYKVSQNPLSITLSKRLSSPIPRLINFLPIYTGHKKYDTTTKMLTSSDFDKCLEISSFRCPLSSLSLEKIKGCHLTQNYGIFISKNSISEKYRMIITELDNRGINDSSNSVIFNSQTDKERMIDEYRILKLNPFDSNTMCCLLLEIFNVAESMKGDGSCDYEVFLISYSSNKDFIVKKPLVNGKTIYPTDIHFESSNNKASCLLFFSGRGEIVLFDTQNAGNSQVYSKKIDLVQEKKLKSNKIVSIKYVSTPQSFLSGDSNSITEYMISIQTIENKIALIGIVVKISEHGEAVFSVKTEYKGEEIQGSLEFPSLSETYDMKALLFYMEKNIQFEIFVNVCKTNLKMIKTDLSSSIYELLHITFLGMEVQYADFCIPLSSRDADRNIDKTRQSVNRIEKKRKNKTQVRLIITDYYQTNSAGSSNDIINPGYDKIYWFMISPNNLFIPIRVFLNHESSSHLEISILAKPAQYAIVPPIEPNCMSEASLPNAPNSLRFINSQNNFMEIISLADNK